MLSLIAASALGAFTTTDMPGFDRIASTGSVDVEVTVDPSAEQPFVVRLDGDPEAIEKVELSVSGDTLEVRTGSGWTRGRVRLLTTLPVLKAVELTGSGDLEVEGLAGTPLDVRVFGSGDVRLGGTVGDLDVKTAGSGDVKIAQVKARRVVLAAPGSGDLTIAGATERLRIDLMGSGDVDARRLTATEVDARLMGSGDVALCAKGELRQRVMGSGDIVSRCD